MLRRFKETSEPSPTALFFFNETGEPRNEKMCVKDIYSYGQKRLRSDCTDALIRVLAVQLNQLCTLSYIFRAKREGNFAG